MDYRQVEGHHNLVRDMNTGAILNVDQSAYQAALLRHHNAEKQKNQLVNGQKENLMIQNQQNMPLLQIPVLPL